MTTPCLPEHTQAVLLMRAVIGAERQWPELVMFHAIPNGGHRSKRTAAAMKAEGVRPGVPDYCLPVARGGHHGLYLELKRTHGGRLSPEQRAWIAALKGQGYAAHVAHGWQDAFHVIRDYLAADGPEEPDHD